MKTRGLIIFCVAMLGLCRVISAQPAIAYQNKALFKALKKHGLTQWSQLKELVLTDSLLSANRVRGKYYQLTQPSTGQVKYVYVGRVATCRAGGCSVSRPEETLAQDAEYFDYFICFDADRLVHSIKIFNYQATHGHEITAKGWLKQFVGYAGAHQLQVNQDIDAISGATISVYAIVLEVELRTALLQQLALNY